MNVEEHTQKYSYDDYQQILRDMNVLVKKYRNKCIRQSKRFKYPQNIINITMKICLGTTIGGGVMEIITKYEDENLVWVKYTRFVLELMILCLVATNDIFKFEKRRQEYVQAQTLLTSFQTIIHQQILVKRGYEGDRAEVIKQLNGTFEDIKSSNIIIQEFGIEESNSTSVSKEPSESDYDDARTEASVEEGKVGIPMNAHFSTLLLSDMMDRM